MTTNLGDARKRAWAPRRPWTKARRANQAAAMKPSTWTPENRAAHKAAIERRRASRAAVGPVSIEGAGVVNAKAKPSKHTVKPAKKRRQWSKEHRAAHQAGIDRRWGGRKNKRRVELVPIALASREPATRVACAELGMMFQRVPGDGREHRVPVYDDIELVWDRSDPHWERDRRSRDKTGKALRPRANAARKGVIRHGREATVVVNNFTGIGRVLFFDSYT